MHIFYISFSSNANTVRVFNFKGFKLSWFLWLLAIHENVTIINITAQAIKYSADPQKYKPTHFLCFGNPQNFNLSKLNTLTVIILCWINRRIIIYTVPCVTVKYSHLHPVPPTASPLCGLSARSHDPDKTHLIHQKNLLPGFIYTVHFVFDNGKYF